MVASVPVRKVFLEPGDVYFGAGATRVETVLGSCVSIVLSNPRTRYACMSHCLLPRWPGKKTPHAVDRALYRYVDTCVPRMLALFEAHGGTEALEVRLFGGADMFETSVRRTVGAENVRVAIELLKKRGLAVLEADTGGTSGRKVRFHTWSGEVLVRRIQSFAERSR